MDRDYDIITFISKGLYFKNCDQTYLNNIKKV